MSFTEKSSWVMAIILSGLGILYAKAVFETTQILGETGAAKHRADCISDDHSHRRRHHQPYLCRGIGP